MSFVISDSQNLGRTAGEAFLSLDTRFSMTNLDRKKYSFEMNPEKVDQSKFNLMSLPRQLIVNRKVKRRNWYILVGVLGAMFLPFVLGLGFAVKDDLQSLNFKTTGIQLVGKIEQIRRVTGRYGSKNIVTYSYQYADATYYGEGVERYGSHKPADSISVYVAKSNPNDSRAEFSIGEEAEVYARIRSNLNGLWIPIGLFFFFIFNFGADISPRPKC